MKITFDDNIKNFFETHQENITHYYYIFLHIHSKNMFQKLNIVVGIEPSRYVCISTNMSMEELPAFQ